MSTNDQELELRTREENYRSMRKYIKDHAIFMFDNTRHIPASNQMVNRIRGYSIEEAIGNCLSMFFTAQDLRVNKPE